MSNFKPTVRLQTQESIRAYRNDYTGKVSATEVINYKTYRELKKNLTKHIGESIINEVSVSRSRRGEWGEWFEIWKLDANNKPVCVKKGWM